MSALYGSARSFHTHLVSLVHKYNIFSFIWISHFHKRYDHTGKWNWFRPFDFIIKYCWKCRETGFCAGLIGQLFDISLLTKGAAVQAEICSVGTTGNPLKFYLQCGHNHLLRKVGTHLPECIILYFINVQRNETSTLRRNGLEIILLRSFTEIGKYIQAFSFRTSTHN